MKFARLGARGHEDPAMGDDGWYDLRPVTADIDGDFLSGDGADRARTALHYGRLPAHRRCGHAAGRAPIARPGKIVCIGLNYRDHAAETGAAVPAEPVVFFKDPRTVIGPDDDVLVPRGSARPTGRSSSGSSSAAPARYLECADDGARRRRRLRVSHDVSEREFQLERGGQWDKGKSCETFNPLGPWLVTADEVADPQALGLRLWVNGELRQNGTTADMIFPVAEVVRYLSQFMVLNPGDVINTGTPAGVALGLARHAVPAGRRRGRAGDRRARPAAADAGAGMSDRAGVRWPRRGRHRAAPRASAWPPPSSWPRAARRSPPSTATPRRGARAAARATARDVTDRAGGRRGGRSGRARASAGSTSLVNNAGHRRAVGTVGGQRRRRNGAGARHQRRRHGPGVGRRAAAPAPLRRRRDREHLLGRGARGLPQRALYSASKGAVLALTLAMAADHVREGIRVNCVSRGRRHPVGATGCCRRPTIPMPSAPLSRPASPSVGSSSPTRSRTRSRYLASPLLRLDDRDGARRRRRRDHVRVRRRPA